MIERAQAAIVGTCCVAVPVGAIVTLARPHAGSVLAFPAALTAFWLCAVWAKRREKRVLVEAMTTWDAA